MFKKSDLLSLSLLGIVAVVLVSCATTSPESHYNQAVDQARMGNLAEAEREYKQAISSKPDILQAHNNLGVLYLKQSRLEEAEAAFKRTLSIKEDYPIALENLAETYEAMGQKEGQALAAWKAALQVETRPDIREKVEVRVVELEAALATARLLPLAEDAPPVLTA